MLELHPRPVGALGDEPQLDLARPLVVGLDLPFEADVPAEDDPVRRLVDEHPRPRAFAPSTPLWSIRPPTRGSKTISAQLGRQEVVLRRPPTADLSVKTLNARSGGASTTIDARTDAWCCLLGCSWCLLLVGTLGRLLERGERLVPKSVEVDAQRLYPGRVEAGRCGGSPPPAIADQAGGLEAP